MMDELFQCLFLLLVGLLTALYFLYRFRNGPKTEGMKGRAAQVTSAKLSALYSVPVKNDPSERRLKRYEGDQLMKSLFSDATTCLQALQRGHKQSNDGECLGRVDRSKGNVEWTSYGDALKRMQHFGDGLVGSLQQRPKASIIGMYSINRLEYSIVEYGCYWHSMIIAPIYNTLGPDVCTFIANQAEIEVIVCDTLERVEAVLSQVMHFTHLKHIVVMEEIPYSYVSKAKNFKLEVHTMKKIEEFGKANSLKPNHPSPDDDAVICYTSGTTGKPKGVILTHGNVLASASGLVYQMYEYRLVPSDILLSYLPLAHIMERVSEVAHFMVGAKVAYFSGDILTLMEDIKIVRPTIFLTVPRLLNKIYDKIIDNVRGNLVKEWMLRTALAAKARAYREGKIDNNTLWDRLIFNKVRNNLGGRIRVVATGSASINAKVGNDLRSVFGCIFLNGYGQTECSGTSMSAPFDRHADSVGPPLACTTIKLEDIPEMNYYASEGKGEILVKGPLTTKGYYKDAAETEKLFDEDGWLHTGDVGAWTEEGTLRILDRKRNHFKLSQGEFIPVEKLETSYAQSPFVAQIYVYGDSSRSHLVAVVVPEKEFLGAWCFKNGITINFHDQCKDSRVKKVILEDLRNIAIAERFNKLEYVKRVYLHTELLTIESGLLTPTMKAKRFEMQRYFGKIIEELYKQD